MFRVFNKKIHVWDGALFFQMVFIIMTLVADSTTAHSYEESSDFEGGHVTGTIFLNGQMPQPKRYNLVLFPDPYYCGRISDGKGWRISPFLQLRSKDGIPGVIVFLHDIKRGKPLRLPRQVIQAKNCEFSPYITQVSHGKTLTFENWDPVPHDIEVYEYSEKGGKFIFRQPLERNPKLRKSDFLKDGDQSRNLPGPGVTHQVLSMGPLVFRCSFHEYMEAWGFVLNHPYFSITGGSGEFTITDIPPGNYQLVVWHPLGRIEKHIEISPSGTLSLDLEFTPTSPITYAEDDRKSSPYDIDLIGDSQIVPTVELQQWDDSPGPLHNSARTPPSPGPLP
jgi:plastocyanin